MKNTHSLKNNLLGALTVVLLGVVVLLGRALFLASPSQSINGLYQSHPVDHAQYYNAQFFGNEYYIEQVARDTGTTTLSQGTFEPVENSAALYLLTDVGGQRILVTLEHGGFYFYDSERNQVVCFSLIVPSVP